MSARTATGDPSPQAAARPHPGGRDPWSLPSALNDDFGPDDLAAAPAAPLDLVAPSIAQRFDQQQSPARFSRLGGTGRSRGAGRGVALTEMAGWMAHDSGHDDRAAGHFARAFPLAQVSGDLALAAHIAASRSHLALHCGDAAGAVHWADTGLGFANRAGNLPSLFSRLHTMRARALAASSHRAPAARALDEARRALAVPADATHPWLSPFDAAALASESALVCRDLERYDTALAHAEDAVRLREDGRARSLALSRIVLAEIHVRRGEIDASVAVGRDLLVPGPSLGSVRVVHELDRFRKSLEPFLAHRPVREYVAQLDDVRRTRMLLLADILTGGATP